MLHCIGSLGVLPTLYQAVFLYVLWELGHVT